MAEPRDPLFDDEPQSAIARLLPPLVLLCAFGGFIALAIYAYKAGTQSVNEGELMVIEADNSPVKEKPQDPGGMQFPNQDKTIFETFSAGNQTPPQVERVLPTPEEPIAKEPAEASEPTTWVNEKLAPAAAPAGAEKVFGDEDAAPKAEATSPQVKNVQEELAKQAVSEASPAAAAPVVSQPAPVVEAAKPVELALKEEVKVEELKVVSQPAAPKPEAKSVTTAKTETKPAEKPKAATAKGLVQLGAYKTEAEAKGDFAKMQKKHAALAGKSAVVNRADLGDKGIFYRLRVGTDDAKALCAKLAAGGQACMPVK